MIFLWSTQKGSSMKQFLKVFQFEFKQYLKNKMFVGITLFIVLVSAVTTFVPVLISNLELDSDKSEKPREVMLLKVFDEEKSEVYQKTFTKMFEDYEIKLTDEDDAFIKEQIQSDKAECAFVLTGLDSYTYYVKNYAITDFKTSTVEDFLVDLQRYKLMKNSGMSEDEAKAVLTAEVEEKIEDLGKNQSDTILYTYIMIFALYMLILSCGQMVASSVANEKSSRAMEVLITSAKPNSLIFGKVFASCLAGFLQLSVIFGSSMLLYQINEIGLEKIAVIRSIFDIPIDLFVYLLVFFFLGFLIYAFIYSAIGSTVSRLEDISAATMPVTYFFMFAVIAILISMFSVENTLLKVLSFIPFTSPMAMFTRIAMTSVPWYEIAISLAILVVSVVGIGMLSAKIYKVGVLLYGVPPKISTIIKAMKK